MTLDQMEVFENGSESEPDIEPHIFGLDGRKLDPEDHYRELVDEAGYAVLRTLRAEIVHVLGECAVAAQRQDGTEGLRADAGRPALPEREAAERKVWESELRWLTKTARAF